MKLRLQGSTLRLRLRRSDVEQLLAAGRVEDRVPFPGGALVYSLVLDDAATVACADMKDGEICVRLPRQYGLEWCQGPETSLVSSDVTPAVLVERDFVRTAVEEPDDFDRFTNPRSGRQPPPRPRDNS